MTSELTFTVLLSAYTGCIFFVDDIPAIDAYTNQEGAPRVEDYPDAVLFQRAVQDWMIDRGDFAILQAMLDQTKRKGADDDK